MSETKQNIVTTPPREPLIPGAQGISRSWWRYFDSMTALLNGLHNGLLQVFSQGALVGSNVQTINVNNGIVATANGPNSVELDSFIIIEGVQIQETLALANGLYLTGAGEQGQTLNAPNPNDPTWFGEGQLYNNIGSIEIQQDLSLSSGAVPFIVQTSTLQAQQTVAVVLTLANTPTVGNYLIFGFSTSDYGAELNPVVPPGFANLVNIDPIVYGNIGWSGVKYDGTVATGITIASGDNHSYFYAEVAGVISTATASNAYSVEVGGTWSTTGYVGSAISPSMLLTIFVDQDASIPSGPYNYATPPSWNNLAGPFWQAGQAGRVLFNSFETSFESPVQATAYIESPAVYANGFIQQAVHQGVLGAGGSGPVGSDVARAFAQVGFIGIPTPGTITLSVGDLEIDAQGTFYALDPAAINFRNGLAVSGIGGKAGAVNVDSFIIIQGQTVEQTLALGGGLSISGTADEGLTLSGTQLDFEIGTSAVVGTTVFPGANVTFTQGTSTASGFITIAAPAPGVVASVGTVASLYPTIVAGGNISLSGTAPSLTISGATTVAANTVFEQSGTSVGVGGTINAGTNLNVVVAGGIATLSSSGGGGGGYTYYTYNNTAFTFDTIGYTTLSSIITTPHTIAQIVVVDATVNVQGSALEGGIFLDGTVILGASNVYLATAGETAARPFVVRGICTIPGDNAAHTLTSAWADADSTGTRTIINSSLLVSFI